MNTQLTDLTRGPAVASEQMADEPSVPTLTALLAQRARDAGDREFLRFGEWSWSFAEIDAWTSRLAHRMLEVDGVRAGDRIAIMLPNVVHWPVVWLAALKAGAVAVPVNCGYQRADLAFVLRDSGARAVFTDSERAGLVNEVLAGESGLAAVRVIDVADDGSEPFPDTPPSWTRRPTASRTSSTRRARRVSPRPACSPTATGSASVGSAPRPPGSAATTSC